MDFDEPQKPVVLPTAKEWKKTIMERGASESDNPNYKLQLHHLSKIFVISLAKMFVYTGMFDTLEICANYQFLREREWGKRGGRAWDIKIKVHHTTTGRKLANVIENFIKLRTPQSVHQYVFCVVKTLDYVKKIRKMQIQKGGDELMEVDKPKMEGCQKCTSFSESGHARGSHAKKCKFYTKPITKKAKTHQAYREAVAAMNMAE